MEQARFVLVRAALVGTALTAVVVVGTIALVGTVVDALLATGPSTE